MITATSSMLAAFALGAAWLLSGLPADALTRRLPFDQKAFEAQGDRPADPGRVLHDLVSGL